MKICSNNCLNKSSCNCVQYCTGPLTLDVDKLLLGQRLPVNGIGSILCDVLLYETAFKYLVGDWRDTWVFRYLV